MGNNEMLGLRACDRERKFCPLSGLRTYFDFALVIFHNLVANGKSQPRTLSHWLCRKKWIE